MSEAGHRTSILDYFEGMSDVELQSSIGPVEAFCIWFDDLYFPCFEASDYKDGVYEKGLEIFLSCFSENELKAMTQYHKFIDSIVDDFDVERDWLEIQSDPQWKKLTNQAKIAQSVFNQS